MGPGRADARRALRATIFAVVTLLSQAGCAGGFVWVQDLPPQPAPEAYVIAAGDVLWVRVFNQDNISTRARVRSDGMIAVPFIGDVEVRGKTPAAAAAELETRLKRYVVAAAVTITVEESLATSVAVLGEIAHPGNYAVDASAGVLQAIAAAGGFTDYASRGAIYVVRRSSAQRIRFTYAALVQGDGQAASFRIRSGDVVVVE
jgi:polysaccharide export outer membrane protein